MSNNINSETAQQLADEAAKLGVVPAQSAREKVVTPDMDDAVKMFTEAPDGYALILTRDENGQLQFHLEETAPSSKVKSLFGKVKGVVSRNKKLVIATAGLLVASAAVKVLLAGQENAEDGEIVEDASADDTDN